MKTKAATFSVFNTFVLLGAWSLLSGCAVPDVNSVMDSYHFTAISPPQLDWENGSVVEIDPRFPNAPIVRSTPSMVPIVVGSIQHDAPQVSQVHEERLDLSLGVSVPEVIKASLAGQGVRQYSVIAEGNVIWSVPLDSYTSETFPKIAEKFGSKWTRALKEDKNLFYFYEVWLAKKLMYKFYDATGISVNVTLPKELPADVAANWKQTTMTTLVFEGPGWICLGYKARPIREAETGEIVPMATGNITAEGKRARKNLDNVKRFCLPPCAETRICSVP